MNHLRSKLEKYYLVELCSRGTLLGPRHTRHLCTQYCDKNTILSHRFLLAKVCKLLVQSTYIHLFSELTLVGIETHDSKMTKFCNIFLSTYFVQKCLV